VPEWFPNSRARSIKTRIETFLAVPLASSSAIREQDPLKQGLKLYIIYYIYQSYHGIREQDPLKQGLKLLLFYIYLASVEYSRARSIKTRIETSNDGGNDAGF